MNMTTKIERAAVKALVEECKDAGYVPVKVWDGGDYVDTASLAAVLEAVFSVDMSTIHFAPADGSAEWGNTGVLIVCGNGEDCISDWHSRDEVFNAAVGKTCERLKDLSVTC